MSLQGSFGGYPERYGSATNVATLTPTLGWQVLPRLGVQAGAALDTDVRARNFYLYTVDEYGRLVDGGDMASRVRQRTLVVPVLARYTLTKRAERRLQFDVLGGGSLVHVALRQRITPIGTASSQTSETTTTSNSLCMTLGGGARYTVWKGLELTAEAVLNRQIVSPNRMHKANPNLAAGLLYRFGSRG
ncbi:hypothetical protein [Hymenobacter cellulosilyticus]|uniref:Outer membrane protein beta-barrel domain-containing protein n=1 Tax=Hymenobacter cellulosilyticus TaxID=2932248 RepID=A0A8T9Q5W6_9BACT|nr:hypothetical protein [Hymenobacter cellulosilyticus]UOQ73046.1 hypothetical protein MUN79_03460 [Hymenobacter cellulosilyticus]